jgi:ABC-type ATPase involved in cell division
MAVVEKGHEEGSGYVVIQDTDIHACVKGGRGKLRAAIGIVFQTRSVKSTVM